MSRASLSLEVHAGRRRTIVIPKFVAEMLGIEEGSKLKLTIEEGGIVLEPIPDAVTLSIRGEKMARASLEELEAESVEHQKRCAGEAIL